jgi:hypothetical protein
MGLYAPWPSGASVGLDTGTLPMRGRPSAQDAGGLAIVTNPARVSLCFVECG